MHMPGRTMEHSWTLKQGKIFPHEAISLEQAVWALYLLVRKCSRSKAHSYVAGWGTEDSAYEIAFPNKGTSIYGLNQVSVENRKRKVSKSLQYPIF